MKTRRESRSWAIDVNDGESYAFIGRYWDEEGFPELHHPLPTRLFDTRREARDFCRKMKSHPYKAYPKARVVRVRVVVEAEEASE